MVNTIEWYAPNGKLIKRWRHTTPCWEMNGKLTFENEKGKKITISMDNSLICWSEE